MLTITLLNTVTKTPATQHDHQHHQHHQPHRHNNHKHKHEHNHKNHHHHHNNNSNSNSNSNNNNNNRHHNNNPWDANQKSLFPKQPIILFAVLLDKLRPFHFKYSKYSAKKSGWWFQPIRKILVNLEIFPN